MFSYIYITFLVFMLSYSIYRDIMVYKKGDYKSYPFKEGKRNRIFNIFIIVILFGSLFFINNIEGSILLIIFYIFASIVAIQRIIFNYLVFKKTKDKKIIFNTFMYIVIMIIVFRAILKWVLNISNINKKATN
jgi:heme O synthase-like polyprenyltransferase